MKITIIFILLFIIVMKKMKLILIILGVCLAGITAVIQYIQEEKEKKEAINRENNLNAKIDSLQKDNLKLSEKLTETSLKLNEVALGSSELSLTGLTPYNNGFRFKLTNESDLPIYDTNIFITNYNILSQLNMISENEKEIFFNIMDREKILYQESEIITINPKSSIIINKVYTPDPGLINFSIHANSRKDKIVTYYVIAPNIEKGYLVSSRTYQMKGDSMILKKEYNGFEVPKNHWNKAFFEMKRIRFINN